MPKLKGAIVMPDSKTMPILKSERTFEPDFFLRCVAQVLACTLRLRFSKKTFFAVP